METTLGLVALTFGSASSNIFRCSLCHVPSISHPLKLLSLTLSGVSSRILPDSRSNHDLTNHQNRHHHHSAGVVRCQQNDAGWFQQVNQSVFPPASIRCLFLFLFLCRVSQSLALLFPPLVETAHLRESDVVWLPIFSSGERARTDDLRERLPRTPRCGQPWKL